MEAITSRWRRMVTFLGETKSELKKVTYPSRQEVVATTIVVVVASAVFAAFLWLADLVITRSYEGIFRVLGS